MNFDARLFDLVVLKLAYTVLGIKTKDLTSRTCGSLDL